LSASEPWRANRELTLAEKTGQAPAIGKKVAYKENEKKVRMEAKKRIQGFRRPLGVPHWQQQKKRLRVVLDKGFTVACFVTVLG